MTSLLGGATSRQGLRPLPGGDSAARPAESVWLACSGARCASVDGSAFSPSLIPRTSTAPSGHVNPVENGRDVVEVCLDVLNLDVALTAVRNSVPGLDCQPQLVEDRMLVVELFGEHLSPSTVDQVREVAEFDRPRDGLTAPQALCELLATPVVERLGYGVRRDASAGCAACSGRRSRAWRPGKCPAPCPVRLCSGNWTAPFAICPSLTRPGVYPQTSAGPSMERFSRVARGAGRSRPRSVGVTSRKLVSQCTILINC